MGKERRPPIAATPGSKERLDDKVLPAMADVVLEVIALVFQSI